jgi:hypothetical protein
MRRTTIATLVAICAALAIAPATSIGKTVSYEGPVDLTYIPGAGRVAPAIQLKVTFAGKVPKVVPARTLRTEGLYGPCVPGAPGCNACSTSRAYRCLKGQAAQCFLASDPFDSDHGFQIRNRRFSGTLVGFAGTTLTVSGRVSKRSVTGTVHAFRPASQLTGDACDTGVLTWTAS